MYLNQSETTKKPLFIRIKRKAGPAIFVIAWIAIIFAGTLTATSAFSETAHAGLISFMSKVMGNQEVSARTKQSTHVSDSQISRTIVLEAPANPHPLSEFFEIPPIYGDTALSPDIARMNATSTEPLNTQISIYTVRVGDTVSGVAKMFNVSVSTILWTNQLTSKSYLKPGQTLVILPVTGITYTIKSRDTIQSIAKKYGADVDDILNYNDLTLGSALKIGDTIIIPDAEIPTVVVPVTKIASGPKLNPDGTSALIDGLDWPSYPGYYSCPVPGARLSQGLHGHNGIDLAMAKGTPIHATADGTVIISRGSGAWNGGYGNFVSILHGNGSQTLYAHMLKTTVYSGQNVSQGEVIGYIGMTGKTTGPHVHFEVRGAANPFAVPGACY